MDTRTFVARRRSILRLACACATAWCAPAAWCKPAKGLAALVPTPAQVEGPFYPTHIQADRDADLTRMPGQAEPARGEAIWVQGQVLDVTGEPLADALLDLWHANHFGRYRHRWDRNPAPADPGFQGWALIRTDEAGHYRFKTVRPGAYGSGNQRRARHIHFKVSHPGVRPLTTQMYFAGDTLLEQDLEIARAPATHRSALIAQREADAEGLAQYRFDVVLGSL